jgi:hypothetical protein
MMTNQFMDGGAQTLIISSQIFKTYLQKTLRLSLKKIIAQLKEFLMVLGL